MSRYIDADLLYAETEKKIKANNEYRMAVVDGEFLELIDEAPTEDVVEVVRCKDCKYGTLCYGEIKCTVDEDDCGLILYHEPQHFCSYGERREEE